MAFHSPSHGTPTGERASPQWSLLLAVLPDNYVSGRKEWRHGKAWSESGRDITPVERRPHWNSISFLTLSSDQVRVLLLLCLLHGPAQHPLTELLT